LHYIKDDNFCFDNPDIYKIENFLYSYKSLIYISYLGFLLNEKFNQKFSNCALSISSKNIDINYIEKSNAKEGSLIIENMERITKNQLEVEDECECRNHKFIENSFDIEKSLHREILVKNEDNINLSSSDIYDNNTQSKIDKNLIMSKFNLFEKLIFKSK